MNVNFSEVYMRKLYKYFSGMLVDHCSSTSKSCATSITKKSADEFDLTLAIRRRGYFTRKLAGAKSDIAAWRKRMTRAKNDSRPAEEELQGLKGKDNASSASHSRWQVELCALQFTVSQMREELQPGSPRKQRPAH